MTEPCVQRIEKRPVWLEHGEQWAEWYRGGQKSKTSQGLQGCVTTEIIWDFILSAKGIQWRVQHRCHILRSKFSKGHSGYNVENGLGWNRTSAKGGICYHSGQAGLSYDL